MKIPSPDDQVQFLLKLQRLLNEGSFVATYKFALLLALAELSVEHSDGSGNALLISTPEIAEKFIQYYWRQSLPFIPDGDNVGEILRQNTGPQAAIINQVAKARELCNGSLIKARSDEQLWEKLVLSVDRVVRVMPLWKLQTIGRQEVPFLYDRIEEGHTVELKEGVAYNFRLFHHLIRQLIEGAWVRHIRSISTNQNILGEVSELRDFLFGSGRENLSGVRIILRDIQEGICFYCERPIPKQGDVDHFIPWSRYPVDLGHNFVFAHSKCNRQKRDFLAAEPHLEKWINRNIESGSNLTHEFSTSGITSNQQISHEIARWAYEQAENANAQVWWKNDDVRPISVRWKTHFTP